MNGCHGKTVLLWLKAEEGDAYPRGVIPVRTLLQGVALCVHSCKEPVAKRSLPLDSEKSSLLTASGNTQLELRKSAEN